MSAPLRTCGQALALLSAMLLLAGGTTVAAAGAAAQTRPGGEQARGGAPAPRTSLAAIERQAMCVTCKIPLPEARSPQADAERALIVSLIARGLDEAQVKRALVAEYGPAVLALPPAHGFDLLVYIIPVVAVLLAMLVLALALPRWRRRAVLEDSVWGPPRIALSSEEAARLDADLARFEDY